MRAITVSEFGPPSVLVPAEVATPTPGPGQALIEVTGAGVGPWDVKLRDGSFGPHEFPYIPGAEVSGLVTALGAGTTGCSVGDAVFGRTGSVGGYAEYAVVDADKLAGAPERLDLEAAGAVPIGSGTAMEGLDDHLHVAAGQSVLVAGAAGGVGAFVVQIAVARGARVLATAGPEAEQFLLEIGADQVFDYHGDWMDAVRGVDAAFDCVGGPTWEQALQCVRPGGRAVSIANFDDVAVPDGVTASTFSSNVNATRLQAVARLIDDGAVRVEIQDRIPLDDAARAHEILESGGARGKIVLVPG